MFSLKGSVYGKVIKVLFKSLYHWENSQSKAPDIGKSLFHQPWGVRARLQTVDGLIYRFKVPLRVQQFFCFWKLFVALNNCANFVGVLTNLNGFIGLRSCRFRAVLAISSVHDR